MTDPDPTSPAGRRPDPDDGSEDRSRIQSGSGSTGSTRMILDRLAAHAPRESRYRVKEEIARGGMGAILRVFDRGLGRELAMKVILKRDGSGSSNTAPSADDKTLGRFLEEAQVTGQLDHPCIVPVHELGLDSAGSVFFTMQLVKGRDLREIFKKVWRKEDGWNLARALGVIVKVCEAMAYAHSKQVIHRDLKPANIMVGRYGEVYVMDWGLARVMGHKDLHDLRISSTDLTLSSIMTPQTASGQTEGVLTLDGEVLGTPAYMPPEQARGEIERVGPRSDIYSVGAILYHLLARQRPYQDERLTQQELLIRLIERPPKPLGLVHRDVPPELIGICDTAMAREPSDRYSNVEALAEDLRSFLEGRVVHAFETGPWAEFKKWVRRNRALATTMAAAIFLAFGGLGSTLYVQVKERRIANQHAETARAAQRRAEQSSYVANVTAAGLEVGNAAEFSRRLDACPEEWRAWEWQHLNLRRDLALETLTGHTAEVTVLAISTDGRRLATGSSDSIRIWDTATRREQMVLKGVGTLYTLAFDATGRRLVCSTLNQLLLWDLEGGEVLAPLLEEQLFLPDSVMHPVDGLVACAENQDVIVWSTETGAEVHRFTDHSEAVDTLQFSEDGRWLASASSGGELRLWALGSHDEHRVLVASDAVDRASVRHLEFLGESGLLASSSSTAVTLWDTTGVAVRTLEVEQSIEDLCASPDGRYLAIGFRDANAVVWDRDFGETRELEGRVGSWHDLVFSTDSQRVFASDESHALQGWDVQGQVLTEMTRLGEDTQVAALRADQGLVFTGHLDGSVRAWRLGTRDGHVELRGHGYEVMCAAWSPDGTRILSGALDGRLFVWDAGFAETVQVLAGHVDAVNDAAWVGEGRVLSASEDGTLRLWDVATGRCRQVLYADGPVTDVVVTPDRSRAVSGGAGHSLDLWNLETGQRERRLSGLVGEVRDLACLDEQRVVSASSDGALRIWDLGQDQSTQVIDAAAANAGDPDAELHAICICSGNRVAASVGTSIQIWNLEESTHLDLRGHAEPVLALASGLVGDRLVSASSDGSIRLWDVNEGLSLLVLEPHGDEVRTLAVHGEGSRLVSGSYDRTLRIWETEPDMARKGWAGSTRQSFAGPLLERLLAEHSFVDEAARELQELLLDADLRATALRGLEAQRHWVALQLSRESRSASLSPDDDVSDEERQVALDWARAAWEHDQEDLGFLIALGMAQYRSGAPDDRTQLSRALQSLSRAEALVDERGRPGERAFLTCFLAMTYAALGNHDDARELVERARVEAGEESWELQPLLEECEAMLGAADGS